MASISFSDSNFFMKKTHNVHRFVYAAVLTLLISTPFFTHAVPTPPDPGPPGIDNPLSNISDIPTLITTIVDAVTTIGYYVVVIFIIYAGFLFVKARGDKGGLEEAKKTFLWTVVGAAVLLGASILSNVIKNTVTQVGGVSSAIVEHIHV